MASPDIFKARSIRDTKVSVEIKGHWIPARPYRMDRGLWHRLRCAWLVFTAQMDVLDWEQEPPEAR